MKRKMYGKEAADDLPGIISSLSVLLLIADKRSKC